MADHGGQPRELVFCHACKNEWYREQHGLECPRCHSDVVEIIDERHDPRDNRITISDDDSDHVTLNRIPSDDSLPRHPLHHHNPWRNNAPDPDEPDIEHVEWNPAPGVHFTRMSYRSTTPGQAPWGQAEFLGPLFQGFSTMLEGAANAPGRPPGHPRSRQSNHIHRPEFASQDPFPDHHHHHMHHHHHGPWASNGPPGGRSVYTATGRWPTNEPPGPFPGARDADNIHAVLGTLLQTMQAGTMDQGHRPHGGFPNMHTFISSILGSGAHGDAVHSDEALDRIITQMMDQHNAHSAPGPASAAAIAALPKQKVDKSMMGQDGKAECSVCMDAVEIGDEVTVLPCKHWFHGDCVGAWLKEHDTCPHCRQGIMPKDAPETSDTPRSPGQEPRHNQNIFPFPSPNPPPQAGQPSPNLFPIPSPNQSPQAGQPPSIPGAFTQPGMQQPYVPGGFPQYPEPRNFVTPPWQDQGRFSQPPSPQPQQQPQQSQHHYTPHRRRSSARERSHGSGGEGSSSSSGQGVTGWFRRLGGGNSSSGDR